MAKEKRRDYAIFSTSKNFSPIIFESNDSRETQLNKGGSAVLILPPTSKKSRIRS